MYGSLEKKKTYSQKPLLRKREWNKRTDLETGTPLFQQVVFLWGIMVSPLLPPSETASPLEIIIIDQGLPQGGRPSSG